MKIRLIYELTFEHPDHGITREAVIVNNEIGMLDESYIQDKYNYAYGTLKSIDYIGSGRVI